MAKKTLPNLGTPVWDRIVVLVDAPDEKTAGGIYIPETSQEAPLSGVIVAIGPGNPNLTKAMQLKLGDHILFGKYAGSELTLGGVDYLVMKEADALHVLPE